MQLCKFSGSVEGGQEAEQTEQPQQEEATQETQQS